MVQENAEKTNAVRKAEMVVEEKNLSCTRSFRSVSNVMYGGIGASTHRRSYLVNFLVVMFGIGASIGANGFAAELPVLIMSAPEGSKLSASLAVTTVAASVGPALYALFNKSASPLRIRTEFIWISSILILGTTAMGILAFFYSVTATINAVDHSVVMLSLVFVLTSVSGLRNVFLMPYLRHFEDAHLTSFFIGEGLSGVLSSTVALVQGVGGDPVCPNSTANSTENLVPYASPPKFPARDFFLFLSTLMVCSTGAFWLLEYLRVEESPAEKDVKFRRGLISAEEPDSSIKLLDHNPTKKIYENKLPNTADLMPVAPEKRITDNYRRYLCVLMFVVCFAAHGYLHNMEVFSSRPYGNSAYNFVVNLSQLAGTMSCVLVFWLSPPGQRVITAVVGFLCIGTIYVTWLAMCSPTPPWRDTTHGVVLLVTVWVVLISLTYYAKLAITEIVWQETSDAGIYQVGFAMLFGSSGGCILSFFLVNFTTLLTPYSPCRLYE